MPLPSVFDSKTTEETFHRLEKLNYMSKPLWGKMSAAQMLAHLNVTYDLAYGKIQSNPSFFTKLMLKLFVKGIVTNEKPYTKNSRTGPDFIITDDRDFEKEKSLFIDYVKKTESLGVQHFEGKESSSFGVMTSKEWSTQFYKHIDHHFRQFGV
ncbi:MAG: hypothetical protein K0S53_54 [Bacteroidetes bacterium]|jgi:hypothetical protein|nr:hypothetical protein [Bacteroidota bacterium]MDF2452103.1 hypothetical protein [Bacteroidota bacterium]